MSDLGQNIMLCIGRTFVTFKVDARAGCEEEQMHLRSDFLCCGVGYRQEEVSLIESGV